MSIVYEWTTANWSFKPFIEGITSSSSICHFMQLKALHSHDRSHMHTGVGLNTSSYPIVTIKNNNNNNNKKLSHSIFKTLKYLAIESSPCFQSNFFLEISHSEQISLSKTFFKLLPHYVQSMAQERIIPGTNHHIAAFSIRIEMIFNLRHSNEWCHQWIWAYSYTRLMRIALDKLW